MAEVTTLGRLEVDAVLPPEYRTGGGVLTGKELTNLLTRIGRERPEMYREVSHSLMRLGRDAAYTEGVTMKLSDVVSAVDKQKAFEKIEAARDAIMASAMSQEEKDDAVDRLYSEAGKAMQDQVFETELERGNPLALQVESKARGSKSQLAATIATPVSYRDAKGGMLPMLIRRSYADGLKPWEYFGASFGARTAAMAAKLSTPLGGDLAKQMTTMASDLIVTQDDCGTVNGVPFDVEDQDNVGALLARDVAGFKAGATVTPKMLEAIKKKGYEKIVLRSPITCQSGDGLCKKCAGEREDGKLPELRSAVGIQAASAMAERVAQGMLRLRHEGRGKGSLGGSSEGFVGYPAINQLVQVPETFSRRAAVAELDGEVESVKELPQGGFSIVVGGTEHYVEPGLPVTVKRGDRVDAGDQLSGGLLNPADVVRHKGVGEGRRYLAERLTQVYRDSGLGVNRRNAEVVARAVVNRVDIDDPHGLGDYLPGDSVSYSGLAYSYAPRKDAAQVPVARAVGKYLEQPALHYSIGTRLTRRMADQLKDFGAQAVTVHDDPPGFTPVMERLRGAPAVIRKDWMAKLQGSNLKAEMEKSIQAGESSEIHGTHPMPGLAYAAEFGRSEPGRATY